MDNLFLIIAGIAGVALLPALRTAIKSYRARKSAADIIVDALEAAIDEVDKKWHSQTSLPFTLQPSQHSVACLAM